MIPARPIGADVGRAPWLAFGARQRWTMLAVLFLVSTVSNIDRQIMAVAIEPIKADFHASDSQMGLLTGSAFALFYATLGLPIARWADRGDRKLIIALSITFWSVMTTVCGAAQNFTQLFLARIGVGGGESGALPTSQSLIADYFPPETRGLAIGIFTMAGATGYVGALILGAQVAARFGWHAMFTLFGISSIAIAVLAALLLREPRRLAPRDRRASTEEGIGQAIAALIRKPSFVWQVAGAIFYGIVCYGALLFFVSHLIRSLGLPLAKAGAVFGAVSSFNTIVGALVGGYLTDRLGRRSVAAIPLLAGAMMLAALPACWIALRAHDLWTFVIAIAVGGSLTLGIAPPLFAGIHAICGTRRRATAIATLYLMMNSIGLGGGPVLTGLLSDHFGALYGGAAGLRIAMLIAFAALLPGAICFLAASRSIARDVED